MRYHGFVNLDRELSYSIAHKLVSFFNEEHKDRPYVRTGLMLADDGRTIRWNSDRRIVDLHTPLADTMLLLKGHKITGVGIFKAFQNDEDEHQICDIVILKNIVKLYKEGKLETVEPTPI